MLLMSKTFYYYKNRRWNNKKNVKTDSLLSISLEWRELSQNIDLKTLYFIFSPGSLRSSDVYGSESGVKLFSFYYFFNELIFLISNVELEVPDFRWLCPAQIKCKIFKTDFRW